MFLQRFIFTPFLLFLLSAPSMAAEATFSWIPNSETNVIGYKIYYGTSPRNYTDVIDTGLPDPINGRIRVTVSGLVEGETYYFAATAYDSQGAESDYSEEILFTVISEEIVTRTFGNTSDADYPGTLEETFTNINAQPLDGLETISTWSWSSPSPHKVANTALLKADLSSIPASAIIIEARLHLYQTASHGENSYINTIHKITGHNPIISEVSGYNAALGVAWNSIPPGTTSNDVPLGLADIGPAEDTVTLDNSNGYRSWTITAMVSQWVTDPASNYGLLISGEDGMQAETGRIFAASEYSDSNIRPKLVVTYAINNSTAPATAINSSVSGQEDTPIDGVLDVANPSGLPLQYIVSIDPLHGTITVEDATGQFTYTPEPDFYGQDSFSFTATNDNGESNTATVTINVHPVNDPPTAQTANFTTDEDTAVSGQLHAIDIDGDTLHYALVAQPSNGTVTLNTGGTFTYTPGENQSGTDALTFKTNDGTTNSNIATVTFTVNPVNDAPVAMSANFTTDEDITVSGQLSATDLDGDALTYALVTEPNNSAVTIHADGTFTYIPSANWSGTDALTFKTNDGTIDSNNAIVTFTVNPINDAPITMSANFTTDEDITVSGQLSATDLDGDALTYALVTEPSNGVVTLNTGGTFTYIPSANWSGTDTLTFKTNDGTIDSNTVTVTFIVNPVNDAPIADDLSFSIDAGSTISGLLTATDQEGDSLSFTTVSAPTKGIVVINTDGSFSYSAEQDAAGTDTFTFKAGDGSNDSHPATVSITLIERESAVHLELSEIFADSIWQLVDFDSPFTNPVVIARATTFNDEETGVVRIRNVTSTGFELRFQEWDSLDDQHPTETISVLVVEAGAFTLDNGTMIEAGCFPAAGTSAFSPLSFLQGMTVVPVVMTSINTVNEADAVTTRIRNITEGGFEFMLREQEANGTAHGEETVCYLAWEPSTGSLDNMLYEVASTEDQITHSVYTINYNNHFIDPPLLLASMQTADGADTAVLRVSSYTGKGMSVFISEEQSKDSEIRHTTERGGYIAITPYDPAGDPDGDTLTTTDEETLYNTDPSIADTDHDGIDDGAEITYWQEQGSSWDVDIDSDGLTNLLDQDADGDGMADGAEIAAGFNPGDPSDVPGFPIMEGGEVDVTSTWVHVDFAGSFANPVIIARLVSKNDNEPCVVRIDHVTSTGFDLRLQEYEYLDDAHPVEQVSYLVMEAGHYTLADGTQIEAGIFTTNATSTYDSLQFTEGFSQAPVVITTISSFHEADPVTTRIRNISQGGFEYKLQEQEANAQIHLGESLAYIAWEPSNGSENGIWYKVDRSADTINHATTTLTYATGFSSRPLVYTDMQSTDGGDTAILRMVGSEAASLQVTVEEEQSKDTETYHTTEVAGFIAILAQ